MKPFDLKPARDLNLSGSNRLRSLDREPGLVSAMTQHAWWAAMRAYFTLWHRLRVEGREHLPDKPPFVLVGNHTSHLDACVLASVLPARLRDRIFPIAAGDVFFQTPLVSAFAAFMLNALPMWRKNCGPHALEQLRRRLLDDPCAFILFPEGGRSRDGSMMRFKPGLGMLIAGTPVPVTPCHLSGCFEAFPAERRLPRPCPIRLRIGEPVLFRDVANDRAGWNHIAATLEERVRALKPG